MTGYHKALWDRIPDSWRLAAKQCKCKERMINNIYKDLMTFVYSKCAESKKWSPKFKDEVKKEYLKTFCNPNTPFCWAFNWEKSTEGYKYWSVINDWINYFKQATR